MDTDEATSHRESGARHKVALHAENESLAGLNESFVTSLNGCVICLFVFFSFEQLSTKRHVSLALNLGPSSYPVAAFRWFHVLFTVTHLRES